MVKYLFYCIGSAWDNNLYGYLAALAAGHENNNLAESIVQISFIND